jgi:hypothetical protein
MRNSIDMRRVAVWLVGAMFSACACLFLVCACLGVRAWAVAGKDSAPPAADAPSAAEVDRRSDAGAVTGAPMPDRPLSAHPRSTHVRGICNPI